MAKIVTGVVVVAVLVVGLLAILNNTGTTNQTIKLGVLLPLTGDAASYGESELRAIQIAVDEVNAAGGVNERQIELVVEDGKCDSQAGGSAAQKLINVDGVKIIIGGACSEETLAASKVTEPARVILISPSASSSRVTEAGNFVFRTSPSELLAGKIAATYAFKELSAKKAAIVSELTDYAQGLREIYKKTFTDLGGTVVADETYTTGDADFRTQILKIKQAKADVVYVVPQTAASGVIIFKQLRENKINAKFTTAEVLMDSQIVKDNASVLEGVVGVEVAVDYEGNSKAKAFRDAHRAKFGGADPGIFAANAYDAVHLIHEGLAATMTDGTINTAALRDWLYALKAWSGAVGPLSMDLNGDPIMGENVRKIMKGEVADLGAYTP